MLRTIVTALTFAFLAQPVLAETPRKMRPARSAPKAPAPPPPPPPAADAEQLHAATEVLVGDYACEFKETIHVQPDTAHDGWMQVRWRKARYTMKPVLSRTGAVRLEDLSGRMLVVQIANKSMLMDVVAGERRVDDCVHPVQHADNEARKLAPPEPGLGIDPNRPAAVPAPTTVALPAAAAAASAPL